MEKFGCLGLLVILLGLGIPISSVGYHPKYSERWGVVQCGEDGVVTEGGANGTNLHCTGNCTGR